MQIDEAHFRAIVLELIDNNPLACRAVLSICDIDFTDRVETLAVTLGRPSSLKVNLQFVQTHCANENHVKALLIHEFLHILLRHTSEIKIMTPALNVALDAVINAIIHRRLGADYSEMMSRYYEDAPGPLRLLRPMNSRDQWLWQNLQRSETLPSPGHHEELEFFRAWKAVYEGTLVADDMLDLCRRFCSQEIEELLKGGRGLLGGHCWEGGGLEVLEVDVAERLKGALQTIDGTGIWRDAQRMTQGCLRKPPPVSRIHGEWRSATRALLQRLIVPDPRSRVAREEPASFALPVLNASDRRGCLRTLWNPLLPEVVWSTAIRKPAGSVQVYLDVSGSMNAELQALLALLAGLLPWIKTPFWAFSTEVVPAVIRKGRLETHTSGGTSLSAVLAHAAKTRPRTALIITDGFVEKPKPSLLRSLRNQRIEALVSATGTPEVLENLGIPVTRLPMPPETAAG